MLKKTFMLILMAASFALFAQENPKIDKKKLLSQAENVKSAKRNLKKAEKSYRKGFYDAALQYYVKLHRIEANDPAMNYKMGISTLYGVNPQNAISFFDALEPSVASDYYCQKGIALVYSSKYKEAKDAFYKYLETLPPKEAKEQTEKIQRFIAICDFSTAAVENQLPVFVENLGPGVNGYYDDYSAAEVLVPSKALYFTSRRPYDDDLDFEDHSVYNERLLYSDNFSGGKVTGEAKEVNIKSNKHLSVAGTDFDRNNLLFFKGKRRFGDIRTARFKLNGKVSTNKRLNRRISQKTTKEASIAFDAAGNAYFVSVRDGGYGGQDIWYAAKKGTKRFEKPVNLGANINTPLAETGVYVTPDGNTLYFSTNGRPGMGGMDVFKSVKDSNGQWGEPVNMGTPINSHDDDVYYRITSDTTIAVLSSKRVGGFGGLDIYTVRKDLRIPFEITGVVTDAKTDKPLAATVSLYDKITNMPIVKAPVDTTKWLYLIALEDTASYYLQADMPGYRSDTAEFPNPTVRHAQIVRNFALHRLLHPYTLSGYVTDEKNGKPLQAELLFKKVGQSDVLQRVVSEGNSGAYSVTFEDKVDVDVTVKADKYYDANETLLLHGLSESSGTKNFALKRSQQAYIVTGVISDIETNEPLIANIRIMEAGKTDITARESSTSDGKYEASLPAGGSYQIEVTSEGYFFINQALNIPSDSTTVIRNFAMQKLEVGKKAVIDNILFNFGKATLQSSSFASLNKVVDLLRENPKLRLEISGHTDNVGSAAYNKKLSRSRALTVKNYLVSQGINEDRLEFEGYGFDQPVAPNTTDAGRALNRRVEMKVLDNK